jgi:hypothetical protein
LYCILDASVGGAFHDRLTEKFSGQPLGGDDSVNLFQMLQNHPFVTEPNDSVVLADQNKQKISGQASIDIPAGRTFISAGQPFGGHTASIFTPAPFPLRPVA